MANTLAPFGFRYTRQKTASSPTMQMTQRRILKTYATAIFHNDVVVSLNTGYINLASSIVTQVAGIFVACEYFSVSQNRYVWMPYWPGNGDAQSDPLCYIIDDPDAVFAVQCGNGASPIALAGVQGNIGFLAGTGNTYSGLSGMGVDTTTGPTTTATLPFRILGYMGDGYFPGTGNGSDPTTAYNILYVGFNNQDNNVTLSVG